MSTHDGFYKQIDGLVMGSPPAPHLANGWLSQFDKEINNGSSLDFRYMDDILKNEKKMLIEERLNNINKLHEFKIHFGKRRKPRITGAGHEDHAWL